MNRTTTSFKKMVKQVSNTAKTSRRALKRGFTSTTGKTSNRGRVVKSSARKRKGSKMNATYSSFKFNKKSNRRPKSKHRKKKEDGINIQMSEGIRNVFKILMLSHQHFKLRVDKARVLAFILGYCLHQEKVYKKNGGDPSEFIIP